ncbi:metallophosphoesterase [Clostridium sp. CAG:798]|jgi:putative metallophosphoesterase|nr:metallophosphoesterase [Clostridium sp. CAG:798]HBJ13011.1 TIGR00282 family metallophosphoesterase [Clostridiales bacterium]
MRILAVGDLVGECGLNRLKQTLPRIKEEKMIDFVIVNAENVSGGMGITIKDFNELLKLGIDVITMGNHTWAKKDIFEFIDNPKLLRPANYSKGIVGKGMNIYECKGKKIAVINLIGRTDMNVLSENPFTVVENLLKEIKVDIVIIDFHAEATAEKIAMKYFLDGKATVLFGTHTHVQTADEDITKKGLGYITDLGMTGPKESVIGMNKEASIKRFLTSLPERYKVAEGESIFNACIFEINEDNCRTIKIERINLK